MNKIVSAEHQSSLFLCRTPLQACICLKIIERKNIINFDLIYFTQDDSDSDRLYFRRLKVQARASQYIYVRRQRFDMVNHFLAYRSVDDLIKDNRYLDIYVASIDSLFFRTLLRGKAGRLYTFDDGAANVIKPGIYDGEYLSLRARVYTSIVGALTPMQIRNASQIHYTIYSDIDNIVPRERTEFIDVFDHLKYEVNPKESVTFFIGQPFSEYLSELEIFRLRRYLNSQKIQYYLMHPREQMALISNAQILDKGGELAEIAIFETARGRRPRIISCFSSVVLNISGDFADKVYLSVARDLMEKRRLELMATMGCEIVQIDHLP